MVAMTVASVGTPSVFRHIATVSRYIVNVNELESKIVKYRPTDAELLDAIATLLEDEVLPVVPPSVQHKVRVAANLARILERQQAIEPPALAKEQAALADVGSPGTELEFAL